MEQDRLAKRFQAGDWDAFLELWEQYQPLIHKLTHHPLNPDFCNYTYKPTKMEKEDIRAECRMILIQALHEFDDTKAKASTFIIDRLTLHIHNYALRQIREEQVMNHLKYIEPIREEEAEKHRQNHENLYEEVKKHFQNLSKRQQEVMHCLFVEKLTNKETAEKLNLHKDVVARHKSQAIKKLKMILNEDK